MLWALSNDSISHKGTKYGVLVLRVISYQNQACPLFNCRRLIGFRPKIAAWALLSQSWWLGSRGSAPTEPRRAVLSKGGRRFITPCQLHPSLHLSVSLSHPAIHPPLKSPPASSPSSLLARLRSPFVVSTSCSPLFHSPARGKVSGLRHSSRKSGDPPGPTSLLLLSTLSRIHHVRTTLRPVYPLWLQRGHR